MQNLTSLPTHLKFTIRLDDYFNLKSIYPYQTLRKSLYDSANETSFSDYFRGCFLSVQNAVERAFITKVSKNSKIPNVVLKKFPYPAVTSDAFLEDFGHFMLPTFIVIAFLYSTKIMIKVSLSFFIVQVKFKYFPFCRTLQWKEKIR